MKIHDLCCSLRSCWCPWVMQPSEVMMQELCCHWAASEGFISIHSPTVAGSSLCGLCCHQKACGWPSWMLQTVKSNGTTFVWYGMSADAQLRGRDMESFCDNPYLPPLPTPKVVAWAGGHQGELLSMMGMLRYGSPQLMESGWGPGSRKKFSLETVH